MAGKTATGTGTTSFRLDAASLKALSHPLRLRLLTLLREHGPATATELARRIGDTTSGTTSYHLRRLARHGFVAETPEQPGGRDRRWHAVHSMTNLNIAELIPDPSTQTAMLALLEDTLGLHLEWLRTWLRAAPGYDRPWVDATAFSDRLLHVSPDRLAELLAELGGVISRYAAEPSDPSEPSEPSEPAEAGSRPVALLLYAFPRVDLTEDGPAAGEGHEM